MEIVTLDFEKALHNAFLMEFPKVRIVGCLFHFKYRLWKKAQEFQLATPSYFQETKKKINFLEKICWNIEKWEEIFTQTKKTFPYPYNQKFFDYFEKEWIPFVKKSILNYSDIDQRYRANSILESYYSRM